MKTADACRKHGVSKATFCRLRMRWAFSCYNLRHIGMEKNFDGWNRQKKEINSRRGAPFCHERELWWCSLGLNVGSEQDGSGEEYRRPVLILKGLSVATCVVIPLTTSARHHPLRPSIGWVEGKDAHALLSQMRVIDTRRLVRKIGYLERDLFEEIRKAVRRML